MLSTEGVFPSATMYLMYRKVFKYAWIFNFKLSDLLKDIRGSLKSILDQHLKAVILIDRYGTQLASVSSIDLQRETLSKVSAVLYGSAERLGETLSRGSPRYIIIEYNNMVLCIVKTMSGKYVVVGVSDGYTQDIRSKLEGLSVKL
ncbi:hypothetical protein B9Q06_07820 [Candidatus Marsarchaeota G2 archaeon ECH_B_2]|uniref:Roadblock/LAMTOR2 domain-containing protein n=4 Tax=Candidatus Marsarchaeota group 2 TaxID=2203771 RepID=A0A2R6B834_9ARCH|nr:MAG: hypothetical protein B9Q06_07820 [Candidatus Marsarchaeota G2 archaeon ECH_B_2]PSN99234.1 MAG: hypothetical protein B9Q07_07295 [Candidatus Marsarchaeota G2 archaeon ECH_B_3]PSO01583.1 MAG: hypothetical protein B9Q05_08600 [Candidatus Marsarchaeota G2 archaeon ECH_B_1]